MTKEEYLAKFGDSPVAFVERAIAEAAWDVAYQEGIAAQLAAAPVAAQEPKSPMLDEFLRLANKEGITHLPITFDDAPVAAQEPDFSVGVDSTAEGVHVTVIAGNTVVYSQLHAASQPAQKPIGYISPKALFELQADFVPQTPLSLWPRPHDVWGANIPVYIAASQPAQGERQPTMVCSKCGADRLKEDCKGDRMNCDIRGTAQGERQP